MGCSWFNLPGSSSYDNPEHLAESVVVKEVKSKRGFEAHCPLQNPFAIKKINSTGLFIPYRYSPN
jgi:hypothetical protein